MPKGVYIRTEKYRKMMSDSIKNSEKAILAATMNIGMAAKLPRSEKQKEQFKIAQKVAHETPRTLKQIEIFRKNGVKTCRDNSENFKRYIKGEFKSYKNRCEIFFSSSYELHAYIRLEHDESVKQYGRCMFGIFYIRNGEAHKYFPDIMVEYVCGKKEIIEVKPKSLTKEIVNIIKHQVLEKYCRENGMTCKIWTEEDLFNRGKINENIIGTTDKNK